jgi:hypothetical protein
MYPGGESPIAAVFAGHASVLGEDIEGLRADVAWLGNHGSTARWLERSERTLRAGLKALEGDAAGALHDYRVLTEEWRTADLPYDLALTLIERARLLGSADAEAAAGRDEARALMAGLGAEGFVERIEAGLPQPGLTSDVAAPSASGRPAPSTATRSV